MKSSIKDFPSKYDQIPRKLRIWSHLLEKSLIENFIFLCSEKSSFFKYSAVEFQLIFIYCIPGTHQNII